MPRWSIPRLHVLVFPSSTSQFCDLATFELPRLAWLMNDHSIKEEVEVTCCKKPPPNGPELSDPCRAASSLIPFPPTKDGDRLDAKGVFAKMRWGLLRQKALDLTVLSRSTLDAKFNYDRMTSIASLPPELLLQIFHWATYDQALFQNLPSWKNYDLTAYEGEDPWPTPSEHGSCTARALALTCARWTVLATEFELRHITVDNMDRLRYYLSRIRKLVQTRNEGDEKVECPIRRVTLMIIKERVWTEEDTKMVISLICSCPNLEVLINGSFADGEMHAAGPVLLKSLVGSCPKLKRLHWKTMGCMQLLPSAWSSILASSSLATSLEVLEIDSPPAFPAHGSTPAPVPPLELPSLHCLQLSVNEDNASFISAIVDEWQLPSLTSLYLRSSHHPTIRGVISLISTHGQSLTTLAMDPSTSGDIPLHVLPPAPIQELVYNGYDLEETNLIPFASLSTLVVRLDLTRSRSLTSDICAALKLLYKLPSDNLTELKDVVVLEKCFDTLKEPHPIDTRGLTENQRLWAERWQKDTPRLVNRNGVRLYTLVSTDGGRNS